MSKIFAAVLFATLIYAPAASARGGGGAETMPGISFTDMPSYPLKPVKPVPSIKSKHVRWHPSSARDD
jgi:hypothetical protein